MSFYSANGYISRGLCAHLFVVVTIVWQNDVVSKRHSELIGVVATFIEGGTLQENIMLLYYSLESFYFKAMFVVFCL